MSTDVYTARNRRAALLRWRATLEGVRERAHTGCMPRPIYQGNHTRIKRELLAALADGTPCPLCGEGMYRSQRLHLGHLDDELGYSIPGQYYGLVHGPCNERKGGAVNPWNVRGRAAAARAARSPERARQLAEVLNSL